MFVEHATHAKYKYHVHIFVAHIIDIIIILSYSYNTIILYHAIVTRAWWFVYFYHSHDWYYYSKTILVFSSFITHVIDIIILQRAVVTPDINHVSDVCWKYKNHFRIVISIMWVMKIHKWFCVSDDSLIQYNNNTVIISTMWVMKIPKNTFKFPAKFVLRNTRKETWISQMQ